MKNITNKIYEGFFSNVGGSLSNIKKLLAPIFEMNNPNRKRYLDRSVIYDVLVKLPEKFGFDIYKYNGSQTEIIKSIKVTKEEDDTFWVRYSDKDARSIVHERFTHCDTWAATNEILSLYFTELPLKVVMTYDGNEVK